MSNSRDPDLKILFAQAEQEFRGDLFAEDVMRQINHERRKAMLIWSVVCITVLACLAVLASPVIAAIGMATNLLPVSLVEVETEWLRLLLSPINSVAAVLALGALGVRKFFVRVFR